MATCACSAMNRATPVVERLVRSRLVVVRIDAADALIHLTRKGVLRLCVDQR